jgi:hypothetical protein
MTESYDPADFDPSKDHPRFEPKICGACDRAFLNRWVFLRHRPEGRDAINHPLDPNVTCYSDRHLERLGMWRVLLTIKVRDDAGAVTGSRDVWLWSDTGKVSPLEETPAVDRLGHGKGRTFTDGNRHGAHYQARKKRDRE